MSASASHDAVVPQSQSDNREPRAGHVIRLVWVEVALAALAFVTLCIVVFSVPAQVAEPDDGAYHHSIVAVTMGDFLTLTRAQLNAVESKIGDHGMGQVPNQWVKLANGRYISEKDPGYPYLAAPFQALGIIRWAPLFYGVLACLGLFIGARRWLGSFGGLAAVGLYCSSGAAIVFAWRDYMPTFTDASLIAAGSGILLWAMLAEEVSSRRRAWAGLVGFVALEIATFVRYTDIVILGCAVIAVVLVWRLGLAKLSLGMLGWWLASVAVFGAGVAIFDDVVYGGPLTTGYRPGEVTFRLGAVVPNLRILPPHLVPSMPMLILALGALGWIIVRWLARHQLKGVGGVVAGRDLAVALPLAASWLAIWGLYSAYTWTADDPTMVTLQVIRFYV